MRRNMMLGVAVLIAVAGIGIARSQITPEKQALAPDVTGPWTGTWGMYSPPPLEGEAASPLKDPHTAQQKKMDCKVETLSGGKWQATFEGECGRPYKYTIKMLGRQAGPTVLFSGSADLGPKDGGIFDWIGRATDKEFVGFFTSRGYTGTFRLARPKP